MSDPRRRLPSVDALLASPPVAGLLAGYPRGRVASAVRAALGEARAAIGTGADAEEVGSVEALAKVAGLRLAQEDVPSLRRVINASGVVLHTNLGRAPLAEAAIDAMVEAGRGYSNLEYDLAAGRRGSRYVHCT
ncbi:MAG: L-seryl-tRNA(Sec) selenium transferase, partial [Gemmatimonadetes bacterium]|nr:L-seryl-tRNA(Sec) selenium transferase [Gemmatimonadota bacterium]